MSWSERVARNNSSTFIYRLLKENLMLRAKLKETKTAVAIIWENRERWSEATFTTGKSLLCAIGPLFLFTFDPFFQQFVSWHVLWAGRNRGDLVLRFFQFSTFPLSEELPLPHHLCTLC